MRDRGIRTAGVSGRGDCELFAAHRSRSASAWRAQIAEWKAQWPDTAEITGVPGINPNAFMHALSAQSQAAAAFVVDVGQHQMWAAQSLDLGGEGSGS